MDSGAKLAVTTYGSSSAPTVVTGARVEGERLTLTTEMRNPGGGPVTADLSPYVTVIETPAGLDPAATAVVVVDGHEHVLLPASGQPHEPHLRLRPASPPPEF